MLVCQGVPYRKRRACFQVEAKKHQCGFLGDEFSFLTQCAVPKLPALKVFFLERMLVPPNRFRPLITSRDPPSCDQTESTGRGRLQLVSACLMMQCFDVHIVACLILFVDMVLRYPQAYFFRASISQVNAKCIHMQSKQRPV